MIEFRSKIYEDIRAKQAEMQEKLKERHKTATLKKFSELEEKVENLENALNENSKKIDFDLKSQVTKALKIDTA